MFVYLESPLLEVFFPILDVLLLHVALLFFSLEKVIPTIPSPKVLEVLV